jgi:dCTP deaminase
MILSDKDILDSIKNHHIFIDPLKGEMLNPGSYTFTLGSKILKQKVIDLIDTKNLDLEYEEIIIDETGYILNPGDFILGQTMEKVSVSQDFCCILDARTTLARIGLNVLQGSTFIEPGQTASHETLEISNISKSKIKIYPGMKIVKGIFIKLSSTTTKSYLEVGKYGKQNSPEVKE